jgi:hypothetical protein
LCLSCSVAVVLLMTFSIHGSKTEFLFENHVEYLGHGVQCHIEMYCRGAVYQMGYCVME